MIVTYNVLTFLLGIYTVSQKCPPFYFLNNSVTTLPLLMIFGVLNLRKLDIKILQICPPHVSDVATLPWEIQKKNHFQQCHLYVLLIIYVISKNKL